MSQFENIPGIPQTKNVPKNPFTITVSNNMSLRDMQAIQLYGAPIERSSHIGNQYISNQVIAASGIQTNQYDRTLPEKDKNYHPTKQIFRGRSDIIVPQGYEGRLARNLKTSQGEDLYQYHKRALETAYPNANVLKFSHFLQQNREMIFRVISAMNFSPQMWTRKVDRTGRVEQQSPSTVDELMNNLLDITNPESGYIFANEINVLITGIVDYVNKRNGQRSNEKVGKFYHISGPDMIKYFPKDANTQMLSKVYNTIRQKDSYLASVLPEIMELILLPSYHLNLAVPQSHKPQLDTMLNARGRINSLGRERGQAMQGVANMGKDDKLKVIERFNHRQRNLETVEKEALAYVGHYLFPNLADACHHTQYDAIGDRSSQLYIPEYTIDTPASQIEEHLKMLYKLYPKALKEFKK